MTTSALPPPMNANQKRWLYAGGSLLAAVLLFFSFRAAFTPEPAVVAPERVTPWLAWLVSDSSPGVVGVRPALRFCHVRRRCGVPLSRAAARMREAGRAAYRSPLGFRLFPDHAMVGRGHPTYRSCGHNA